MRRFLSGMAVGVLVIGSTVGCTLLPAGWAGPQAQPKAETPGPAQKVGGQGGMAGGQGAGQGMPGAQAKPGAGGAARVVTAAHVVEGQVKLVFTYTGTVQPRLQLNVTPRTAGRIEQLLVDVGSEVKEGDPIAILERGTLQLAIQQAEANLKSAQARLTTVSAGGRPEDIASAEAALAGARARLNQVRSGPTASDLQTAQSAVDTARANLASAIARLETVKAGPTQTEWGSALAAFDSARANTRSAEVRLNQLKAGPTQADLVAAQATVNSARAALTSALDKLEMVQGGDLKSSGGTSNSAVQQSYDAAKSNYDAAVQKLNQLQAGPTVADLQAAQSAHDSAKATYEGAAARVEQMKRGATPQDIQQAQSAVDATRAALASAEARLGQLQKGPTEDELAVVEAAVTQAEQTLALRQQPYTSQDLQSAQAAVEVAKVALAIASANLADTTLVAPFGGIITQRLLSPGATASAQTPVATLISADSEITVAVEESRLARLKADLLTSISVPTYPGESFQGRVVGLAPSGDPRSHTFAMKIVPINSDGKLKAGMFAEIKVTAEERTKALMVPRDAVVVRAGKEVVFVVSDGRAQMRQVVLGLPQESNVEIISGVKVGEQVIVVGQGGLNDGDAVRPMGATGGGGQQQQQPPQQRQQQQQQQPSQQQQQRQQEQQQQPGAPGKTQR